MTESVARYLPIGDYAVIGNCRSAALVGRNGALDWLCLPRFDSPSVFGALLDAGRGGRFQICPSDAYRTERRYIPDTNVLETTFHTPSGVCRLLDLMPLTAPEMDSRALRPEHEVLRAIEGVSGSVRLNIVYEPRPDYARQRPRLRTRGRLGLWCAAGPGALTLLSDVPLSVAPDGASARGSVTVEAGAWRSLSLAYAETAPAVIAPLGRAAQARIEQTVRWWQLWAARCRYAGPYRAAVVRSALTLKLMSYAPSGAIIAAPTTSLPERIGGERNWDYRYCWLRDASFTLRALLGLGYHEEGESFLGWMMHATSLTWPELQVVYDVFGRMRLPERELKHLDGYAGSRPVRIGNDAHGQLQLDVYGEVIDAVARYVEAGGAMDGETARMLTSLGETVCRRWREPDEGIWEVRGGRAQHTHSKVLCWVALDRLIALYESGRLTAPVARFRQEREAIRAAVETRGYNPRLGSYTRTFDGDDLDAALLVLPLLDYTPVAGERMRGTFACIQEKLGRGGLFQRYRAADGLSLGEGAFGICSFWAAEYRARAGDYAGARDAFEQLLGYGNDVGLFAEEFDPESGAALGNFPQAFTHVGLINAALTLATIADGTGTGADPASPEVRREARE